ncbi:MAG: DASH family cryptochrome [Porticoccaceae bacterium]|nr:DASH family cryptochrome [Porticoccaceae bacterium]
MHQVGLFWFHNDLRINDNPALAQAAASCKQLICVYCMPPSTPTAGIKGPRDLSANRLDFLSQSLIDLDNSLQQYGQGLVVMDQPAMQALAQLITEYSIEHIFSSDSADFYHNQICQTLATRYSLIGFTQIDNNRLFKASEMPFTVQALPDSFSKFRRKVEPLAIQEPIVRPNSLPPPPSRKNLAGIDLKRPAQNPVALFEGGETAGLKHLENYFSRGLASTYKETRNGLEGMDYSTKFSPWLANGCLSPKTIIQALRCYEQEVESNDSTYWIYFELLWREYFQWYAQKYGKRLFLFNGIKSHKPSTSFYSERYQKWCQGNTPYPIVNACMKQLNATGYLSNRGRQLAASCFVHELNLDWRYGASYMEHQLVDYDVASNWGNWQYLAGVGADPRANRRFDLEKQTRTYDPQNRFITAWDGHPQASALDSVDAADWPIEQDATR